MNSEKIIDLCSRAIARQSKFGTIPFNRGYRILIHVQQYLKGIYIGHMSWTLQYWKELDFEYNQKKREKENAP